MVPLAIGIVWGGYTLGLWGYCMVKNYNVKFKDLMSFTSWPPGAASTTDTTSPAVGIGHPKDPVG
jgi:hypothetical protein